VCARCRLLFTEDDEEKVEKDEVNLDSKDPETATTETTTAACRRPVENNLQKGRCT